MRASTITLGGLANALLASPTVLRSAIITSGITGNPALAEIDLRLLRNAIVLQYEGTEGLDDVVSQHRGTLDLVVVDPFHTYGSSVYCLERCLELLRPGGTLLCHDCVPPPVIASPLQIHEAWSGVTFAAFRHVMTRRAIEWCTLAADFGIGVAVVPATPRASAVVPADGPVIDEPCWSEATHDDYLARYLADPFGFMRTVCADEWRVALDRLATGASMSDLAATFSDWDQLLPPVEAQSATRSDRRPSGIRRAVGAARRRLRGAAPSLQ